MTSLRTGLENQPNIDCTLLYCTRSNWGGTGKTTVISLPYQVSFPTTAVRQCSGLDSIFT